MLRKLFTATTILFLFIRCSSDSTQSETSDTIIEDTVHDAPMAVGDSQLVIKNNPAIWIAEMQQSTNTFKIHKPTGTRLDTLSAKDLVSLVDNNSIHVQFIKASHDTMYVSIPDSEYLTQRIGSTGAENFMATTTFTLTEMKGIKYVNYQFTEGDHATPGVYSRDSFKKSSIEFFLCIQSCTHKKTIARFLFSV